MKTDVFEKFKVNLTEVVPTEKINELKNSFDAIDALLEGSAVPQEFKNLVNQIISGFNKLNGEQYQP